MTKVSEAFAVSLLLVPLVACVPAQRASDNGESTKPKVLFGPGGAVNVTQANRLDDPGKKWIPAAGATIGVRNSQTHAVVASGTTDVNGNWTCEVPANNRNVLNAHIEAKALDIGQAAVVRDKPSELASGSDSKDSIDLSKESFDSPALHDIRDQSQREQADARGKPASNLDD